MINLSKLTKEIVENDEFVQKVLDKNSEEFAGLSELDKIRVLEAIDESYPWLKKAGLI